jgi:Acetyl-CoA acetyltransferase
MREELDRISFDSHMRASKALSASLLQKEIEPVNVSGKPVSIDEGIRADTTMEKLSMLKPVFSKDGMHTAGNSSQLSDGAAALVIAGENAVKERGITPIARITGYSWAGVESERFIEAPVAALEKLSKKSGLDIKSFDYYENNDGIRLEQCRDEQAPRDRLRKNERLRRRDSPRASHRRKRGKDHSNAA